MPVLDSPGRERPLRNSESPMITGLGTATASFQVTSDDVAGELALIWPERKRQVAKLSRTLKGGRRFLSRPVNELRSGLSFAEQRTAYPPLATDLAAAAAEKALGDAGRHASEVTTVIAVSCTGFILPGLDARLARRLGLRTDVVRVPLTQHGCVGGGAGLARGAERARGSASECVLVVAVELPSLTFRPGDQSVDNVLSALVFGDGAGAAVIEGVALHRAQPPTSAQRARRLAVQRTAAALVPDTEDALGWGLDDDGFRVVLSSRLPHLVRHQVCDVVRDFIAAGHPTPIAVVALHPGGTAIVDAVQAGLGLEPRQLAASRAAFERSGNTSSAAIFFVLEEMLQAQSLTSDPHPGQVLALAFGPGIAVEMLELAWSG